MCLPETFEVVRSAASRRDFLKLGVGAVAAAAVATVAEPAAAAPKQRALNYSHVQDLTHVTGLNTPLFPGFEQVRYDVVASIDKQGFYANRLTYWEHTGTHIDAPSHFTAGGLFIDQIPAARLVAPLAVVDLKAKVARDRAAVVTVEDLVAWEKRYGRLPDGAAVFMNSGWASRWTDGKMFLNADASGVMMFPGFSPEAAMFLATERKAVGIGVDTLSLDHGPSQTFGTHGAWLTGMHWGMENVANLDHVPPSGATIFVGAPKFAQGSGGPTRLIAVW